VRMSLILLSTSLFFASIPGKAAPPPSPPEHIPARANCLVRELVAGINSPDQVSFPHQQIVTDRLGKVESMERAELPRELRGSAIGPVELVSLQLVWHSQQRATYVLRLGVEPRVVGRVVQTNTPIVVHRMETSWFVTFYSNHITDMRQADELMVLAENAQSVLSCEGNANG
jgi:hypothetical protein